MTELSNHHHEELLRPQAVPGSPSSLDLSRAGGEGRFMALSKVVRDSGVVYERPEVSGEPGFPDSSAEGQPDPKTGATYSEGTVYTDKGRPVVVDTPKFTYAGEGGETMAPVDPDYPLQEPLLSLPPQELNRTALAAASIRAAYEDRDGLDESHHQGGNNRPAMSTRIPAEDEKAPIRPPTDNTPSGEIAEFPDKEPSRPTEGSVFYATPARRCNRPAALPHSGGA